MHFCILSQYYPPEIGAPQARLSDLAKYFINCGHEVTVLTAMPNYPTGQIFPEYGGLYKSETMDEVSVIRTYVYPSKSVRMIPRLMSYFSFVLSSMIVGTLLLPRPDFILTESPPLFLGLSGYFLSRIKKARWIFNVSDLWPESAVNLGVIGEGIPLKISKFLEACFYKRSWLTTGQSHEIIRNIRDRFPQIRTHHLSNGVDIETFKPDRKSDILKPWLESKRYSAVYAGLHGIAQGLDQIIDAAAEIGKSSHDLQIIFIGDGAEKSHLIEVAKQKDISNISFVDPQPRDKMPEIWASADIALVPLTQYIPGAVPSKLYEAMASAIPVLLMAEGEAAEIVNNSNCGFAVLPNRNDEIVDKITTLLESASLREAMGKSGRQYVEKNFSRNTILKNFIEYLETPDNDENKY